jgi:hypothetical protein
MAQIKAKLVTVILITCAILAIHAPANASSKASKPGTPVQASSAEKLTVGKVGFTDMSYCKSDLFVYSTAYDSCGQGSYRKINYLTTWAFEVKNSSPTKSASQVRAKVTFFSAAGNILLEQIITIAREIKPGKIAYGVSNISGVDSNISGVSSANAVIMSTGWMIPTASIYQNPITLNASVGERDASYCPLAAPCSVKGGPTTGGSMVTVNLDGIFTVRGPGFKANRVVVFLDAQGNPLGGWLNSDFANFVTGSQSVIRTFALTDKQLATIVTYKFQPQF